LEIWNAELNYIEKKNRGTSSIQLNILILQLTVYSYKHFPPTPCFVHRVSVKPQVMKQFHHKEGS
jgi:hypothetical protein